MGGQSRSRVTSVQSVCFARRRFATTARESGASFVTRVNPKGSRGSSISERRNTSCPELRNIPWGARRFTSKRTSSESPGFSLDSRWSTTPDGVIVASTTDWKASTGVQRPVGPDAGGENLVRAHVVVVENPRPRPVQYEIYGAVEISFFDRHQR